MQNLYPIVEPFSAKDDIHPNGNWIPVLYGRFYKADDDYIVPHSWDAMHKKRKPISDFIMYFRKFRKNNGQRFWDCELFYSASEN